MKTTILNHHLLRQRPITTLAVNIGLFAGLAALPLCAQDDKKIPAGYTEDEWFDPGDWFDGNNIEPAGTDWWDTNNGWSDTFHYHPYAATTPYYYYYWDPIGFAWTTNPASPSQQHDRSGDQQAGSDPGTSMKTASFDGKVDGFKKVNLKTSEGKRDQWTFVRIRLNNGDARVVSLGSSVNLADLKLEKGDPINVSGRNEQIDNRNVLIASRINVDGRSFNISANNGRQVTLEGVVRQFTATSIDGAKEKNLLIRLELKNGKSCVVDLGQGTSLSDLDIEQGSQIRLEGEKTKVKGKSLVVARKISVDGEDTRIPDKAVGRDQSAGRDRGDSHEESTSRRDSRFNNTEPVSNVGRSE